MTQPRQISKLEWVNDQCRQQCWDHSPGPLMKMIDTGLTALLAQFTGRSPGNKHPSFPQRRDELLKLLPLKLPSWWRVHGSWIERMMRELEELWRVAQSKAGSALPDFWAHRNSDAHEGLDGATKKDTVVLVLVVFLMAWAAAAMSSG